MKGDYCQLNPSYLDPHHHSNITQLNKKQLLKTFSEQKNKKSLNVRVFKRIYMIKCDH